MRDLAIQLGVTPENLISESSSPKIWGLQGRRYTRVLTDVADSALLLFYLLKRRYLTGLDVSDDYNIFDEIWTQQPKMPSEFEDDRVIIPDIKMRWAVGD